MLAADRTVDSLRIPSSKYTFLMFTLSKEKGRPFLAHTVCHPALLPATQSRSFSSSPALMATERSWQCGPRAGHKKDVQLSSTKFRELVIHLLCGQTQRRPTDNGRAYWTGSHNKRSSTQRKSWSGASRLVDTMHCGWHTRRKIDCSHQSA